MKKQSNRLWFVVLTILLLILAACGGAETPEPAVEEEASAEQEEKAEEAMAEDEKEEEAMDEEMADEVHDDSAMMVEDELEVFSWWTSGGEAAALDALFSTLADAQPGIEIINATVAGGGGSAARPVLQTRLAGGDPPDTWQVHPGSELLGQYLAAGFTSPLGDLYEEEGWYDVVPSGLVDLMLDDAGQPHAVLAGVHRGNGFWYNKPLLEENGITVGADMSVDEFFGIADTLQTAGIPALCVGDSGIWASAQLFENTLLGVLGPEKYNGLWSGQVAFNDPLVKEAMEIYGRMLEYQNEDHAALSWDQAVAKLVEGGCAFNSMGDWAYGEFVNAGLEDNVDFGWVSHPGTAGSFMIVSDGFTLAKGAPHEEATIEFLRAVGSVEGQVAFNQLKGSICARTDCDRAQFGVYHNWSMDSFAGDALVPTAVHGSAAPADFQQALNDAVTNFVVTKDVDAFANELVAGSSSFSDATAVVIEIDDDEAMVEVLDATELEVFSWWTSGGEAAALDALFSTLTDAQPNIEIINATVAGGGGSAARPVLQTRLAGGDPPDTWQVHPGSELLGQYLAAGYTEPLGDLYEEEGWYDVVPAGLVDLMRDENGQPHAVLAGVHRGNGFWYNKPLLEENGISVGETLSIDEFFEIADTLQAAGIPALCVGDSGIWATAQMFENTLLGTIGPERYLGLWDGSTSFGDDDVKEAMSNYYQMLAYQNEDHSALSWDQAVGKLMEGGCAFNSMGDWAYGEFVNAGLEDNVDFGWVSHPGTAGSFMIVSDGFPLAKDAPHPEATIEWLRAIGSVEGQVAFNQLKGSICARTDCDRSEFGVYHNWSMDSFAGDALVPTAIHGSAAPADFQQALNDAVTNFVVTGDVDLFSAELVSAAQLSGLGE